MRLRLREGERAFAPGIHDKMGLSLSSLAFGHERFDQTAVLYCVTDSVMFILRGAIVGGDPVTRDGKRSQEPMLLRNQTPG